MLYTAQNPSEVKVSQQQNPPGINPKWNPLLEKIPPEFHNQIVPVLQDWDKGVQDRFNEIKAGYAEYEKFKPFVDNNVDFEYAAQAVTLADQLQRDPQGVITQVNDAWGLGFISKEDAEKLVPAGDSTEDDFLNTDDDILKNPQVLAMKQALEQLQQTVESERTSKQQQEENDRALREFEDELNALEKEYTEPADGSDPKPFHRMFVTALIAQGVDKHEAVKQYHQVLAGTVNTDDGDTDNTDSNGSGAPVVMGNGGTQGSGTGDGSVDFGSMSNSDFNDTVEQLLAESLKNNQG